MAVNLDYYRIFYYVAKYQNFTRAAHVLVSSQPSVTRSMQNLEHELGCRLFIRSKRGVTLTPEGELLYERVAPAYESILRGEQELSGAVGLKSGSVSIGATETALHCFLLDKLNEFHSEYPGVRLKITNNSTPLAVGDLLAGRTDMAVVTTPARLPSTVKTTRVKSFSDILVAGRRFSQLQDVPCHLSELSEYPLVSLLEGTMTYSYYEELYAGLGLEYRPDIELATADMILPVIMKDLGIGFVPEELAAPALEKGEVIAVQLAESLPKRDICLIRDPRRPLGTAARGCCG